MRRSVRYMTMLDSALTSEKYGLKDFVVHSFSASKTKLYIWQ